MQNRARGYKAKKMGQNFENLVEKACGYYANRRIALIEKTPEPMRFIRRTPSGQVIAAFEKKAQPDFKGTVKGGRSVVFEAKHTSSALIEFDRVEPHQIANLRLHEQLGADSFVLISIKLKSFYLVPTIDWLALPDKLGKKSTNEKDLAEYQVGIRQGVIDFLDKI